MRIFQIIILAYLSISIGYADSAKIIEGIANEYLHELTAELPDSKWVDNSLRINNTVKVATIDLNAGTYSPDQNDALILNVIKANKIIFSNLDFEQLDTIYQYEKEISGAKINGLLFKTSIMLDQAKSINWDNQQEAHNLILNNTRYFDFVQ